MQQKPPEPALVRPVTRGLKADRANRDQQKVAKQKAKADREKLAAEEAAKKAEQGKIDHLQMFRTNEYSAWNDQGIPTHDAEGKELPKTRAKKLAKEWEAQKKKRELWLASQSR